MAIKVIKKGELQQKQVFVGVLQNICALKFCRIHRKTPVLESLFDKVAGLHPATLLKKGLQHKCFSANVANLFMNTFFTQNTSRRLHLAST